MRRHTNTLSIKRTKTHTVLKLSGEADRVVGGRQADCEVKRWQGITRVRIRSYVGGGMHGLGAVAASQRCIRTRTGRMDLKELTWRAVSPACALGEDGG